ncbi:MAG: RHS repeat-associated core domain-containing protein, partial [Mariprofundaceae bacterium]|nr:RHS repeat-associated core domain-containing protein [Mariprofundaceae bacterium]
MGGYSYAPNHPHAVQTAGGNTYRYDANGNQISGAGRTIQWTSFNKPADIWVTGGYTGFAYDANHNRMIKTTPNSKTHYIGKLVAQVEDVNGRFSAIKYIHSDHLGSINVITNAAGLVISRLRFDVFGKPIGVSSETTRGYTGHEMDAPTGLINMNARLYDPVLGRFLSADTIV